MLGYADRNWVKDSRAPLYRLNIPGYGLDTGSGVHKDERCHNNDTGWLVWQDSVSAQDETKRLRQSSRVLFVLPGG
jgi:hypothetical protein